MDSEQRNEARNSIDNVEPCNTEVIKETYEVPVSVAHEIPKILDFIRSFEARQERHEMLQYQGPLPYEVINNLDKEQKDKIIDDMVESKKRDQENQKKFIELMNENENSERKYGFGRLVLAAIFFLTLYFGSILTNSMESFISMIPIASTIFGGTGIGIYYMYKRREQEEEEKDNFKR